jgi:hypothetical protein
MPAISDITEEYVEKAINYAFELLKERDSHLLDVNINERSLTHKLAMYLEEFGKQESNGLLTDYDFDVEYNRDHSEAKTLHLSSDFSVNATDTNARTVYPDIIIHKRNTDCNLIVIEVKKKNAPTGNKNLDKMKIKAYKEDLNYRFGVFVTIDCENKKCTIDL